MGEGREEPDISLSGGVKKSISAAVGYLSARADLCMLEAGEAGRKLLFGLGFFLAGFLFLAIGYLLMVVAGVGLITTITGWSLGLVGLAASLLHLIGGGLLLFQLRRLGGGFFQESLSQLKKDRAWLAKNPKDGTS